MSKEEYLAQFSEMKENLENTYQGQILRSETYISGPESVGIIEGNRNLENGNLGTYNGFDTPMEMVIGYEVYLKDFSKYYYSCIRIPQTDALAAKEVAKELTKGVIEKGVDECTVVDGFLFRVSNPSQEAIRIEGCGNIVGFNKNGSLQYGIGDNHYLQSDLETSRVL